MVGVGMFVSVVVVVVVVVVFVVSVVAPPGWSPRWSAPPRVSNRDGRGGGANEPHRVPRAVLRELDGRENRTGAVPHPVLRAKKAAEEASVFERSGGFVYIRNFFSE